MNISLSRRLKAPCVLWTGHCNSVSGHGQRWDAVKRKVRGAHVMAWEEANSQPVPVGVLVRHRCDNPPCIEPTHLQLGTHKDNKRDQMVRHPERYNAPPRHAGETHPSAKLSDCEVAELRDEYTGLRGQRAALARKYGISKTQVSNLLERRHRP